MTKKRLIQFLLAISVSTILLFVGAVAKINGMGVGKYLLIAGLIAEVVSIIFLLWLFMTKKDTIQ